MYNYISGPWAMQPGMGWLFAFGGFAFFLIIVWSLFWKALALWRAARKGSKIWFVVLLVVNTLGILEILYLYVFSKKSPSVDNQQTTPTN